PSFTHTPAVVFGAYRIDQEVEKLIQGQPHSIEVLAARAVDDRRAVETSLLKALQSNMLGEDERRRARLALEEYGFVARQSAALLLASEVYDRTMAARVLGQVGAASSLPFLLEALHDPEPIVCTEAVTSLGALGLPSAIGALLDLARRNPELPTPLLGRALSACSVDCIDVGASYDETGRLLAGDSFTGDIDGLEPVGQIEQLPEWLEDHTLADALERLGSTDVEVRTAAAQQLAQFQVQRAVDALAILASDDRDATVRATAVTSLGIIGHESVFASVLISMADEAREVRAAAARALSRLNFDRADAYVRVIDSGDSALMQRVARACAHAGLTTKALDRLASEDRRQAYEAFSLLSLVIKAGESETILTVVEQAGDLNVRLAAARLLALQGQPDVVRRLRRVALGDGTPEKLRNAILEAIYRDDHAAVE
ncbi:MAG TPA: HEAT repeat domain-containing protein, partial [Pyrinomonadaceae bacterium]|nr:HEAT repeat domain-containing protein [Pyrinomonadaceae bacterium]